MTNQLDTSFIFMANVDWKSTIATPEDNEKKAVKIQEKK